MKPVMLIQDWSVRLVPGFDFAAISLPAGESVINGVWQIDVESMGVPATNGHLHFLVTSAHDGAWVARAAFGAGDRSVQCCMIDVSEEYRGRGIARAMYRWASWLFAAPVIPSEERTALAIDFWKERTAIIC